MLKSVALLKWRASQLISDLSAAGSDLKAVESSDVGSDSRGVDLSGSVSTLWVNTGTVNTQLKCTKSKRRMRLRPGGAHRSVLCGSRWINIPRPQDKEKLRRKQVIETASLKVSAVSASDPRLPAVNKARKRKAIGKARKIDPRGRQECRFHAAGCCKRSQCPYGPVGHAPALDEPDLLDPLVEARLALLHQQNKQKEEVQANRDSLLIKEVMRLCRGLIHCEEEKLLQDEQMRQQHLKLNEMFEWREQEQRVTTRKREWEQTIEATQQHHHCKLEGILSLVIKTLQRSTEGLTAMKRDLDSRVLHIQAKQARFLDQLRTLQEDNIPRDQWIRLNDSVQQIATSPALRRTTILRGKHVSETIEYMGLQIEKLQAWIRDETPYLGEDGVYHRMKNHDLGPNQTYRALQQTPMLPRHEFFDFD
jgi:hypothetical protein